MWTLHKLSTCYELFYNMKPTGIQIPFGAPNIEKLCGVLDEADAKYRRR